MKHTHTNYPVLSSCMMGNVGSFGCVLVTRLQIYIDLNRFKVLILHEWFHFSYFKLPLHEILGANIACWHHIIHLITLVINIDRRVYVNICKFIFTYTKIAFFGWFFRKINLIKEVYYLFRYFEFWSSIICIFTFTQIWLIGASFAALAQLI